MPWRRNARSQLPPSVVAASPVQGASFDLPKHVFAYRVFVSEIMLQQTQASTRL